MRGLGADGKEWEARDSGKAREGKGGEDRREKERERERRGTAGNGPRKNLTLFW